jgi:dienelactone hydrolase
MGVAWIQNKRLIMHLLCLASLLVLPFTCLPGLAKPPSAPPEIWAEYDPDAGEWREEIIHESVKDGILNRETYVSAWVQGKEIRVYCKYSVQDGLKKAPGLLNVHGWMGAPGIDKSYVDEGWAVMAFDYCGESGKRVHFTKYPKVFDHGNMDKKFGGSVRAKTRAGQSITDPKQTSDYLWYAVQRRVLSYLLKQKEVDGSRIGAKGYSYGGTIMWNLGMDPRVKAVVAYFGIGWNEYYRSKQVWMYNQPYVEPLKTSGEELYLATIAPQAHVPHMTAATLFLNGTNDHHGGHERGQESFKLFRKGVPWSFAQQARGHHNTEKIGQNTRIWLNWNVLEKETFWPGHPSSQIVLDASGVPKMVVEPASPQRVTKVEIFHAIKSPSSFNRSWRDAEAKVSDKGRWTASLPVLNVKDYVFSFANLSYDNTVVRSTDFEAAIPSELGKAVATDKRSSTLYTGDDGIGVWTDVAEVEGPGGIKGFRSTNKHRGSGTEQLADPKWQAPEGTDLGFDFYCTQPVTLTFVAGNHYEGTIEITASDDWQEMIVDRKSLLDRHSKKPLSSWDEVGKIKFLPNDGSDITKVIFSEFRWVTNEE